MTTHQKSQQLVAGLIRSHSTAQAPLRSAIGLAGGLEECGFEPIRPPPQCHTPVRASCPAAPGADGFLGLVGAGFLHEVELKLVEDPLSCKVVDGRGNNLYHIAAREGNMDMIELCLNTLPVKESLALLKSTNSVTTP